MELDKATLEYLKEEYSEYLKLMKRYGMKPRSFEQFQEDYIEELQDDHLRSDLVDILMEV